MSTEAKTSDTSYADPAYINDQHWGKGGRFIFDPATGIRTPVPDAADTDAAQDAATSDASASE